MSVAYIIGMGAAYTAALWLLMRRLRLPGSGLSARKNAVQPLFCGRGGGVRCPGQPSRSLLALAAGAAVLCGGGCGAGALQQAAPSGPVFGRVGGLSGRTQPVCVGGPLCQLQPMGWPVPLAAVLGAGGAAVLSGMRECRPGGCALWWCFTQPLSRRCWARDCSWPLVWVSPGAFWCWQGRCCSGFRIC